MENRNVVKQQLIDALKQIYYAYKTALHEQFSDYERVLNQHPYKSAFAFLKTLSRYLILYYTLNDINDKVYNVVSKDFGSDISLFTQKISMEPASVIDFTERQVANIKREFKEYGIKLTANALDYINVAELPEYEMIIRKIGDAIREIIETSELKTRQIITELVRNKDVHFAVFLNSMLMQENEEYCNMMIENIVYIPMSIFSETVKQVKTCTLWSLKPSETLSRLWDKFRQFDDALLHARTKGEPHTLKWTLHARTRRVLRKVYARQIGIAYSEIWKEIVNSVQKGYGVVEIVQLYRLKMKCNSCIFMALHHNVESFLKEIKSRTGHYCNKITRYSRFQYLESVVAGMFKHRFNLEHLSTNDVRYITGEYLKFLMQNDRYYASAFSLYGKIPLELIEQIEHENSLPEESLSL